MNIGLFQNNTMFLGGGMFLFALVMIAVVFLKGLALWKSARSGQKWWFIALLVVNLFGLLEIIYLVFFAEKSISETIKNS